MTEMLGHDSSPSSGTPASKKADKRKQSILVITGVVGVGLTYLLWRRSKAGSSTATTTGADYTQPSGIADSPNGGSAGGGPDYSGAMNAIGSELTTMQGQLQTQQSAYGSLEEEFNSRIGGLTKQVTSAQGQLAHDTTTIQHLEHNKGVQAKQITRLTREVHGHPARQAAAHKNTRQTKKKTL